MRTAFLPLVALAGTGFLLVAPIPAEEKGAAPSPQMQAVLDELAALGPRPVEKLSPTEARKQPSPGDAVRALLKKQKKSTSPEPVAQVADATFPGAATPGRGAPLPVRIYTPKGTGPFPVLVYFHGGGWVLASIDAYDASCRALCNAANCVVFSCDYRRAPEHPFPAAADDAFAAWKWVLLNARTFGGDPKRAAVAGESAGGNLAAVVCLRARDEKATPPAHQLLVYPVTDFSLDTPSYREHAAAIPLNREMMKWFRGHYFGGKDHDTQPYAAPLRAKSHRDLPPATILTADIDPLRDDGKAYAAALEKAGVQVEYVNYPGVVHEFFGMGAVVDAAGDAVRKGARGLERAFRK